MTVVMLGVVKIAIILILNELKIIIIISFNQIEVSVIGLSLQKIEVKEGTFHIKGFLRMNAQDLLFVVMPCETFS